MTGWRVPRLLRPGQLLARRSTSIPATPEPAVVRSRRRPQAGRCHADADPEYIAGFADGWIAADGDPVQGRFAWRLRSISHEALDWLDAVAPARRVRGHRLRRGEQHARRTTASAAGRSGGSISPRARRTGASCAWRELEQDATDTFCAIVPGKHSFTLPAGSTHRIAAHANRSARSRRSSPRMRSPISGSRSSDQLRVRQGHGRRQPADRRVRDRAQRPEPPTRVDFESGLALARAGRVLRGARGARARLARGRAR